jgi:hypothetical protein
MGAGNGRIQIVISGPFLLLLIMTAGLWTAGFWLYTHPPPPPPRPPSPPYYVNRTLTAVRPCYQCVGTDGKLKPQPQWRLARATDIPAGEQWWFAPIEDPPSTPKIEGIPMLAVHPAREKDKPWDGFDQGRVLLVVFQDLEPRLTIDHPTPPPTSPPPVEQPSQAPNPKPPPATTDSPPVTTAPQSQ